MEVNNGTIDQVTVEFADADGNIIDSVSNWTSYSIERDFFNPIDSFMLEMADARADSLMSQIAIGMKVIFKVLNHSIMVGFIDSFDLYTDRGSSGKRLVIRGRDRMGMLFDSSIYPNLGSTTIQETYQFKATDTLEKVVKTILASAPGIDPDKIYIDDDSKDLTAATGFGIGIRSRGKTGRGLSKSFSSNLGHLLKPEKGETYLGYLSRICTRAGCEIKMQPGTDDSVYIGPPIYERNSTPSDRPNKYAAFAAVGQPVFWLMRRTINESSNAPNHATALGSSQFSSSNNVISAKMTVDYKDQPSIIIAEGNHGGPTFKKVTRKVICLNELTAWDRKPGLKPSLDNARPSVKQAVDVLTSGSTGYTLLGVNQDLYNAVPTTIANLQTTVSRPKYIVDYNSQTEDELKFYVAQLMAHYQDRYFGIEYEVMGHTDTSSDPFFFNAAGWGAVWAPNLMVFVNDDQFDPKNTMFGLYWIRKIVLIRDRSGGTRTRIHITLPYTHLYNINP